MCEGTATLTNAVGLHARPAVKLMQLAKSLPSSVAMTVDGRDDWIDAKSIVKVMKMKAAKGEVLRFRVAGPSAEADLASLIDLVVREFDE
ncbi:MAG: HPr family phosphocarrier protein [Alphaproteobacteria bacterium]